MPWTRRRCKPGSRGFGDGPRRSQGYCASSMDQRTRRWATQRPASAWTAVHMTVCVVRRRGDASSLFFLFCCSGVCLPLVFVDFRQLGFQLALCAGRGGVGAWTDHWALRGIHVFGKRDWGASHLRCRPGTCPSLAVCVAGAAVLANIGDSVWTAPREEGTAWAWPAQPKQKRTASSHASRTSSRSLQAHPPVDRAPSLA